MFRGISIPHIWSKQGDRETDTEGDGFVNWEGLFLLVSSVHSLHNSPNHNRSRTTRAEKAIVTVTQGFNHSDLPPVLSLFSASGNCVSVSWGRWVRAVQGAAAARGPAHPLGLTPSHANAHTRAPLHTHTHTTSFSRPRDVPYVESRGEHPTAPFPPQESGERERETLTQRERASEREKRGEREWKREGGEQ